MSLHKKCAAQKDCAEKNELFDSKTAEKCCGHDHEDSCGCEHDHGHEENCSCEHNHSHEESCGCGHNHSHEESCGCEHDHGDGCGCGHDHGHEADRDEIRTLGFCLAGSLLFMAAAFGISHTELPKLLSVLLYAVSYLLIGWQILIQTGKNICRGRIFDENLLMSVASLGAFALGDFIEAIAVVMLYQIGELLQDLAVAKSQKNIAEMLNIRPDHANLVLPNGDTRSVSPEEVPLGSRIMIRPGERVPLDCVLLEGRSSLDTAALTGESLPKEVAENDTLLSGSINLQSVLFARTTQLYADSTVQRILKLTQESASKKSQTEKFITRFARVYTPIVFALAALLAAVPPLLGLGAWADWLYRGLVFLVVSCPCALVISVPVSYLAGMGGAARHGVLLKGGTVLDRLLQADTVIFDKTGTLTLGSFEVQKMTCAPGVEPQELLSAAALCEADSTHPIARSVLRYCDDKKLPAVQRTRYEELAGMGVAAEGEATGRCLAGNRRLMKYEGITDLPAETEVPGTLLYLARKGRFLGTLLITDTPKPGVKQALTELRQAGVRHTALLTGDRSVTAAALAQELQLENWRAELLPQDKVQAFEELCTSEGSHLFVGDGINDAPLLARADVGFAMGGIGSDAAVEAADCVLMKDDVAGVALALRCAKRTHGIALQNIIFALTAKAAVLILAACGFAPMWLAIFADVGVALLCVLNATRAMKVR